MSGLSCNLGFSLDENSIRTSVWLSKTVRDVKVFIPVGVVCTLSKSDLTSCHRQLASMSKLTNKVIQKLHTQSFQTRTRHTHYENCYYFTNTTYLFYNAMSRVHVETEPKQQSITKITVYFLVSWGAGRECPIV